MIIVVKNADFSANNIGKVMMPISEFTLAAITASGKSNMTDNEKSALDAFFKSVGAVDNNGIWPKLGKVYLPFVGADVTYGLLNYKTNIKDNTLNSEYLHLVKGGVHIISDSVSVPLADANSLVENADYDLKNSSVFFLNTTEFPTVTAQTNVMSITGRITSPTAYYKRFSIQRNTNSQSVIGSMYFNLDRTNHNTFALKQEYNADFSAGHVVGYTANTNTDNETIFKFLLSNGVMSDTVTESNITGDVTPIDLYMFSDNNQGKIHWVQPGYGAVILGEYLTDTEALLLKAQLETLYEVFKTEEGW